MATACANGQLTPAATTVLNTAVADGQEFCAAAQGPAGSVVVALIDAASGKAATVTGKASAVVAALCPLINGVQSFPVSPPANPAAVPMVAVKVPAVS
jgi:hypothetical protein